MNLELGDRVYHKRKEWPGKIVEIEGDAYYGIFYTVEYDNVGFGREVCKKYDLRKFDETS